MRALEHLIVMLAESFPRSMEAPSVGFRLLIDDVHVEVPLEVSLSPEVSARLPHTRLETGFLPAVGNLSARFASVPSTIDGEDHE